MSAKRRPHRQFARALRPIGQAVLGAELEPLVHDIVRRMRGIRHRTQAGAYLLIDARGHVYLLPEGSATTRAIVRARVEMIVGLYAGLRAEPAPEDLAGAIAAHFCVPPHE